MEAPATTGKLIEISANGADAAAPRAVGSEEISIRSSRAAYKRTDSGHFRDQSGNVRYISAASKHSAEQRETKKASAAAVHTGRSWSRRGVGWALVAACGAVLLGILFETRHPKTVMPLRQKGQQLEARDAQLKARVAQLEGVKRGNTSVSPSQLPARPGMSGDETEQQSEQGAETEAGEILLKIRGYGDFSLHGDNQKGDKTSFSLGELNLFVTSDISEKFKFLSELVFEAEGTGNRNHFLKGLFTGDVFASLKRLTNSLFLRKFVFNAPDAIGCLRASEVDASVKVIRLNGPLPTDSDHRLQIDARPVN